MIDIALPILAALFIWWFSTGAVLYLVGLPRPTRRWVLSGVTVALFAALWGLWASRAEATEAGAYMAFACAITVWAWQEVCFLMGHATGPRREACPAGVVGWKRVSAAVEAILYHELILVVLGAAVWIAVADGINQTGLWTYLVLWTMRLSAKLNLFLGVPFLHDDWLPKEIAHLRSYFRIRPMNFLFPVSVSASTIAAVWLFQLAYAPGVAAADAAGYGLVATLVGLAVLEHWFMVLPLPVAAMWAWAFRSRRTPHAAPPASDASPALRIVASNQPQTVSHELAANARSQHGPASVAAPVLLFPKPTVNGR
ncbi:MAG TPA: putative photosynthetic complex assembly protein PuhE [Vineibacter sp.]|nr:putative photosynthetic complex assembly protein PuhE [Vineibacter sp.]